MKRAILAEIRLRERQRFWFNVTATALTATVNQEFLVPPANYLVLDRLEVTQNGSSTKLIEADLDAIRMMNLNPSYNLPTHFTEYGNQFLLANQPDSAYPINIYYIKQLPVLSADTDTNAWLSACEDVIVYGAAKRVWATTIRNASAAAVCNQLQTDAVNELNRYRDQRIVTAIKPTRF